MKKYSAVIFDLDGTLLNSLEDLCDAVNHTMRMFGYPERTIEEVRTFVGNGVGRLIALSVPGGYDDINYDKALCEYKAYYPLHSEIKTKPYPGMNSLLSGLKDAGIRTAVVSNKPDKTTVRLCSKYFPEIGCVIGEQEENGIRRKPAPDSVIAAASSMGVDLSECVYIGDSEVDLLTARNAGIDCISVLWGFRDRKLLEENGAVAFVSTADELSALLL